jgi:hypothetical protein
VKVLRRDPAEWRLAREALGRVVWVRLALWRWPYASVRARLARRTAARRAAGARPAAAMKEPAAFAWAVRATARRVPKASCLTQALALESWLAEQGVDTDVRIGVARRADGSFEAHAWVEHEGRVLIGALPDMERFSVLPSGTQPLGRL